MAEIYQMYDRWNDLLKAFDIVPIIIETLFIQMVDIRSTEWHVDRKKNADWPKKFLIKFLYIL